MAGATAEIRPMARKKADKPKKDDGDQTGKLVRIHPDVVGKAKVIVGRRNLELGPYLSELLRGPIDREYRRVLLELNELEQESN
jgi:hypothetical protein